MIRALFLSHDSSLYGAQLSLLGLLAHLDHQEIKPIVVAAQNGPLNDAIEEAGIPVTIRHIVNWVAAGRDARKSSFRIGKDFLSGLRTRVWALAHEIENKQIDVVYTNTLVPIEGAIAARLTGRPHIWHLREQVAGNSQLKSWVPARLIPYVVDWLSARIIVNSQYLGHVYARGHAQKKIQVIFNGVNPGQFDLDRAAAASSVRTELGLNPSIRLVTLIGAVIPRKGQMLLAQALLRISQQIPNATFLVIGEGDSGYIREIKSFCHTYGIQERLLFLGWRPDIPRILAATDVLVVAADEEPFGRTVIEAMAAGTPVVSTRCGGPEEIVIDKQTGLLVPRGDADSLARAIEHVLGDRTDAARMSEAGRVRLHEAFTLDAHAQKVQSVIKNVVQGHKITDH